MRFFEEQRKARSRTFYLILAFVITVAAISVLIGFAVSFVIQAEFPELKSSTFKYVTLLNALAIMGVSFFRSLSLKSGDHIAKMLGGIQIFHHASNDKEKQLLNVVEEMSLASGVTMPHIYLLKNDLSVNAFAAGLSPEQSVIAVTQGTLSALTRDELQGVIAHEFSHILNGDMVLNMRMIGVISGLVFLSEVGESFIKTNTLSRRRKADLGSLLGLVLFILGKLGVFSSRLIQAAVSRQRELLADASAAQFTRNPYGLATALAKIQLGYGSIIQSPRRHEVAHLFFAESTKASFLSFLATHPPLQYRILRLWPKFDFEELNRKLAKEKEGILESLSNLESERIVPTERADISKVEMTAKEVLQSIAQPLFLNIEVSKQNIKLIPEAILDLARNPDSARQILLALIAVHQNSNIQKQVCDVGSVENSNFNNLFTQIQDLCAHKTALRFALLQICLAHIKHLDVDSKTALLQSMKQLFAADGFTDISEILLYIHCQAIILSQPTNNAKFSKPVENMKNIQSAFARILFWFITKGKSYQQLALDQQTIAKKIVLQAMTHQVDSPLQIESIGVASIENVEADLHLLKSLNLKMKPRLIENLWRHLLPEIKKSNENFEALRLLCSLIGAPVPSFLVSV